jgi:hypothetical protein
MDDYLKSVFKESGILGEEKGSLNYLDEVLINSGLKEDPNKSKPGIVSDIKRGTGQVISSVGSTLRDLGPEETGKSIEEYGNAITRRNPSSINSVGEALESPFTTIRESLGEVIPQIGVSTAFGIGGRILGGALGSLAGPAGTIAGQSIGAAGGAYVGNLLQEYGGIRSEQRESGNNDIGRAIAGSGTAALLDTAFGAEKVTARVLGKGTSILEREAGKKLLPHVAKQAGIGFAEEAGTEALQTGIERAAAFKDLTGDEAYNEYGLAAIKGGIGGGIIRGGTAAIAGQKRPEIASEEGGLKSAINVNPGAGLDTQSFINQAVGVVDRNKKEQSDIVKQRQADMISAMNEPTGKKIADPVTGIERDETAYDATQRQLGNQQTPEQQSQQVATANAKANQQATQQLTVEQQAAQAKQAEEDASARNHILKTVGVITNDKETKGNLFGALVFGKNSLHQIADIIGPEFTKLSEVQRTLITALQTATNKLGTSERYVKFKFKADNVTKSVQDGMKAVNNALLKLQIDHVNSVQEATEILNERSKIETGNDLLNINAMYQTLTGKDTIGYEESLKPKETKKTKQTSKGESNGQQQQSEQQQVPARVGDVPVTGGATETGNGDLGLLQSESLRPIGTGSDTGVSNSQQNVGAGETGPRDNASGAVTSTNGNQQKTKRVIHNFGDTPLGEITNEQPAAESTTGTTANVPAVVSGGNTRSNASGQIEIPPNAPPAIREAIEKGPQRWNELTEQEVPFETLHPNLQLVWLQAYAEGKMSLELVDNIISENKETDITFDQLLPLIIEKIVTRSGQMRSFDVPKIRNLLFLLLGSTSKERDLTHEQLVFATELNNIPAVDEKGKPVLNPRTKKPFTSQEAMEKALKQVENWEAKAKTFYADNAAEIDRILPIIAKEQYGIEGIERLKEALVQAMEYNKSKSPSVLIAQNEIGELVNDIEVETTALNDEGEVKNTGINSSDARHGRLESRDEGKIATDEYLKLRDAIDKKDAEIADAEENGDYDKVDGLLEARNKLEEKQNKLLAQVAKEHKKKAVSNLSASNQEKVYEEQAEREDNKEVDKKEPESKKPTKTKKELPPGVKKYVDDKGYSHTEVVRNGELTTSRMLSPELEITNSYFDETIYGKVMVDNLSGELLFKIYDESGRVLQTIKLSPRAEKEYKNGISIEKVLETEFSDSAGVDVKTGEKAPHTTTVKFTEPKKEEKKETKNQVTVVKTEKPKKITLKSVKDAIKEAYIQGDITGPQQYDLDLLVKNKGLSASELMVVFQRAKDDKAKAGNAPIKNNSLAGALKAAGIDKYAGDEKNGNVTVLADESNTIEGEARVVSLNDEQTVLLTDQTNKLTDGQNKRLEEFYKEKRGTPEFIARVKADVLTFANDGAKAVAGAIRDIIRQIANGVMSVAIIFNPGFVSDPIKFAVPTYETRTEQVVEKAPAEAAKNMSPAAQRAYEVIFPAIKENLAKSNKFFIVTDKPTATQFIFKPDGTLLFQSKVLVGKSVGDFLKGNNNIDANKITPAGLMTLVMRQNTSSTKGYDFNTVFGVEGVDNGEKYFTTLMHSVWLNEKDAAQRQKALSEAGPGNSRYSFGCINTDKDTFGTLLKDHKEQMDGAMLFVVPDNQESVMEFVNGKAVFEKDITRQGVTPKTKTVVEKTTPKSAEASKGTQLAAKEEKLQFSKTKEGTGATVAQVKKELRDFIGFKENSKVLKIVQSVSNLPKQLQMSIKAQTKDENKVAGFALDSGVAYIIADNINSNNIRAVFMHEVGSHLGLQELLSVEKFEMIVDKINEWSNNKNSLEGKVALKALERVAEANPPMEDRNDELVAYFIEESIKAGINPTAKYSPTVLGKFVSAIIKAFREAFEKLGFNSKNLTAKDIVDMAYGAAHQVIQENSPTPTLADRVQFSSKSNAFKKWFGDSKVVNADGSPKVVYHGTDKPDFNIFDLASWFSDNAQEASAYANTDLLRRREKALDKFKLSDDVSMNGKYVDYAGILSDHENPKIGEHYATDDGVYKYLGKGKWEALRKIDVDYNDVSEDFQKIKLKKVESSAAQERVEDYINSYGKGTEGEGGRVYPVYISIKNPLYLSALDANRLSERTEMSKKDIQNLVNEWKAQGYDGIITKSDEATMSVDVRDALGGIPEQYIPFNSNQIKSAIGNNGEYSLDNPDIRFSIAQPISAIRAGAQKRIDSLPPAYRGPVHAIFDTIEDIAKKGAIMASFTEDLASVAKKYIPSVVEYVRLMKERSAIKTMRERRVDEILTEYQSLDKSVKGTGAGTVNAFLMKATMEGKWAYQPSYLKDPVTIDPEMKKQLDALIAKDKKAGDLVKKVFEHGFTDLTDMKQSIQTTVSTEYDALIKQAEAEEGNEKEVVDLQKKKADALREYRSLLGIQANLPYAPLKRFGNYVVVGKSDAYLEAEKQNDRALITKLEKDGNEYFVQFAETWAEAKAISRTQEGKYALVEPFEKDMAQRAMYGGKDVNDVFERLRTLADNSFEGGSDKAKKAVDSLLVNLKLSLLSQHSARQSENHRRNIAGAEEDMMRSFATQGKANAHFISSLHNTDKIYDQLREMKKEADASTTGRGERRRYYNEFMKRHSMGFNYQANPLMDKALGMTSLWMLLSSPAHFLQNATQPFMMSMPVIAGKHGESKTFTAMLQAYKEIGSIIRADGLNEKSYAKLPADVREAIETLVNSGRIDISLESDLGSWKSDESKNVASLAVEKLRKISQDIESINRVVTAVAAYRLEKQDLIDKNPTAKVKLTPEQIQENSVAYADQIILDTHGDYSGFNAPRFTRQGFGRLITQFRKFQLIQISLIAKLAHQAFKGASPAERAIGRKALAFTLGHTFAAAGVMGMPGFAAIAWIIGKTFGDDDEPDNPEATLRKMIGDDALANLLLKGVPKLAGVDLSGKLGMGQMLSLLPYTELDLTRDGYARAVTAAMGPFIGGLVPKAVDGVGLMTQGDYYKGLEALAPKGIADVMKAVRIADKGITQRNGDVVLSADDVNILDAMSQALGLPTNTITDKQFVRNAEYQSAKFYKERSTDLKSDYVKAFREGDSETMAEIRQKWEQTQIARVRNGEKRQPISELFRAPQEQVKREKNIKGGRFGGGGASGMFEVGGGSSITER